MSEELKDQERAIARTDLQEIADRMTELQALGGWWRLLANQKRREFEAFFSDVVAYRNDLN